MSSSSSSYILHGQTSFCLSANCCPPMTIYYIHTRVKYLHLTHTHTHTYIGVYFFRPSVLKLDLKTKSTIKGYFSYKHISKMVNEFFLLIWIARSRWIGYTARIYKYKYTGHTKMRDKCHRQESISSPSPPGRPPERSRRNKYLAVCLLALWPKTSCRSGLVIYL